MPRKSIKIKKPSQLKTKNQEFLRLRKKLVEVYKKIQQEQERLRRLEIRKETLLNKAAKLRE